MVIPIVDGLFTPRQMANSSLPLLITLGIPFLLSLLVTAIHPKSYGLDAVWVWLATLSVALGDAYVIVHDKTGSHTLWPVEIVFLSVFAASALIAGAVAARLLAKLRHRI